MNLSDIKKGLEVLYGPGASKNLPKQPDLFLRNTPSGYSQFVYDQYPTGYSAVDRITKKLLESKPSEVQRMPVVNKSTINTINRTQAPANRPMRVQSNNSINKLTSAIENAKDSGVRKPTVVKSGGKEFWNKAAESYGARGSSPGIERAILNKAKGAGKLLPFVADAGYIAEGVNSMKQGHPFIGTGQAALGAGGLVMDVGTLAQLLASPETGGATGASAVATQTLKNSLMKKGMNELIKLGAKNTGKAQMKRFGTDVGLELLKLLNGEDNDSSRMDISGINGSDNGDKVINDGKPGSGITRAPKSKGGSGYGGTGVSVEDYILSHTGDYNVPEITPTMQQDIQGGYGDNNINATSDINGELGNQQPVDNSDIYRLLELYMRRNQGNDDFKNSLRDYIDNYKKYQDDAYQWDRYHAALSGLSGNPAYQKLMSSYNPADIEAKQIELEKGLQEANRGDIDKLMEIFGNATLAKQMGLPVEAAFANKPFLTGYTGMYRSDNTLAGKKYTADMGYKGKVDTANIYANAKIQAARLDNEYKVAIANGNIQKAIAISKMANDAKETVALINAAAYGDIGAATKVAQSLGVDVSDLDLTSVGGANGNDLDKYFNR